jgi:hypothetical protein
LSPRASGCGASLFDKMEAVAEQDLLVSQVSLLFWGPLAGLFKYFGINILHTTPLKCIDCVEFKKLALCFQYFAGNRGEGWGEGVPALTHGKIVKIFLYAVVEADRRRNRPWNCFCRVAFTAAAAGWRDSTAPAFAAAVAASAVAPATTAPASSRRVVCFPGRYPEPAVAAAG